MPRPVGVFVAVCALLVMATSGWCVEVGSAAPDFALRTFGGEQLSRASLAGTPLLLVFWNTWCVNCQRELGELDRLAKSAPQGLKILAINTGINDSETKARDFLRQHGYNFAAGFDQDFVISDAYGVRGVPNVCLIDAKGVVRYQQAEIPGDLRQRLANDQPAPQVGPRLPAADLRLGGTKPPTAGGRN